MHDDAADDPTPAAAPATTIVTAVEPPAPKKGRRGTPKSKNGCITCKIRRIKCDEARPACQRCTSTGRRCDGYVIQPSLRHKALVVAASTNNQPVLRFSPLLDFTGDPRDHRILSYFYARTGPALAGAFDSDCWNQLIPQVAFSEPAVQHALISVAIAHAEVESAQSAFFSETELPATTNYILHHYNKAITYLSYALSHQEDSFDVALMCCLLFICLEYIRNNVPLAISHLQGGLSILHEWHRRANQTYPRRPPGLASSVPIVEEQLGQIFYRLRIQWALSGKPTTALEKYTCRPQQSIAFYSEFKSLIDARNALDHILNVSLRFVQATDNFAVAENPHAREGKEPARKALLMQLAKWSQHFEAYMEQHSHELDQQCRNGGTTMRLQILTGQIWLSISLSSCEMDLDKHLPEFTAIVELSESIQGPTSYANTSNGGQPRPNFSFDMGIIAPLFFVACNCRHPQVRERAINLLATTRPRREAIWDADLLVAVARRSRDIEEGLAADAPPAPNDDGVAWPAEEHRISNTRIHYDESAENDEEGGYWVTFIMRPQGPQENWVFMKERIFPQQCEA